VAEERTLRLVLRRPEAVSQVEDLPATPGVFDTLFPKPYYAHQLRLAGYDWPQVAMKLEYRSGHAAERAVRRWLSKTIEETDKEFPRTREMIRSEAVALDLERLDKLQAAYWQDAVNGDLPSAAFCLKVIAQRSALVAPGSAATQVAAITNNTLVVGGTESQYVSSLLKARDMLGPAKRDDEAHVVESS